MDLREFIDTVPETASREMFGHVIMDVEIATKQMLAIRPSNPSSELTVLRAIGSGLLKACEDMKAAVTRGAFNDSHLEVFGTLCFQFDAQRKIVPELNEGTKH